MILKLKILSVFLTSLFFSTQLFAQSDFGIRAGVNFSNISGKEDGQKIQGNKMITGFNIGVTYDIDLAEEFILQPALLFTTKGYKIKIEGEDSPDIDASMKLNYLELPINFIYKPMVGDGNLLLGAGPYLGYGIGGKAKVGNITEKITFGNGQLFKAFDYGANLLFGYQLSSGISAQLNAQLGLGNIARDGDSHNSVKNTQFGISFGYKF